jgi:hypothetical protein
MRSGVAGVWGKVSVNHRVDMTVSGRSPVKVCGRQQRCDQKAKHDDKRRYRTDSHLHSFPPSSLVADPVSGNAASTATVDHTARAKRGQLSSSHS